MDGKRKKERQSLKYPNYKGARLLHRSTSSSIVLGLSLAMLVGCKKKEAPAIIEEAPAAAAPVETDTSATLAEEPALQQVGQGGKPTATFHPSATAEAAGFSNRGSIVVQVSVFKSSRQAAALVEKLAAQGYPAYVAEVENPTPEMSGTYHRVRIGRFQKIADAKAFGEGTLRPAGFDFWVDNRKNDQVGAGGYSSEPSYSSPSSTYTPAPVEEIQAPAEPAAPSGDAWGTPKEPPTPSADAWGTPKSEPSAPAGDAWGTPKAEELPSSTPASSAPTSKPDTGKVNLDEW